MSSTEERFQKDYIATLDGLRAFAVLFVLWQHIPRYALPLAVNNIWSSVFGQDLTRTWPLELDWLRDKFFGAGYLGVDVFFVLSGFLITRILLVDKGRGVPLGHFLVRRFLRIFPIYYLTLLVVWLVQPHPELAWCAFYLSNFYYLNNAGSVLQHSWSLAVEEHFYLLWPLVVYGSSMFVSRRVAMWGLIPLGIVSSAFVAHVWHDELRFVIKTTQYGTMFRAKALACGALLAYYERGLRARPGRTLGIAAAMVAAGTLLRALWSFETMGTWFAVLRQFRFGLTSTGIVMACIAANERGGVVAWFLRSAPLRFIGRISYGVYLYHFVVYYWTGLVDDQPKDLVQLPVVWMITRAVGLTFVIATVSYYVIERPCLKLAGRFRRS